MSLCKLALASTSAQSRMFYKILASHGEDAAKHYLHTGNTAGILKAYDRIKKITDHTPNMLPHTKEELSEKMHSESKKLKSMLKPHSNLVKK